MRVLFFLFAFISASVFAQKSSIDSSQYFIYLIQPQNTLYSISKEYNVTVEEIRKANKDWDGDLKIGQTILIPKKGAKKEELNDSKKSGTITHKVEKGQTLYSISKIYNVSADDIVKINKGLENGLSNGQEILIPKPNEVKKEKDDKKEKSKNETETPKPKTNSQIHIVEKGETFYSLSKKYNISIDSLKLINPNLENGLKNGDTLQLVLNKRTSNHYSKKSSDLKQVNAETLPNKEILEVIDLKSRTDKSDSTRYNIALLLPFKAYKYDDIIDIVKNINDTTNAQLIKDFDAETKIAVEFYLGFLKALNENDPEGKNIEISVFDTSNDTLQIVNLFKDEKLQKADLIIGPLYPQAFYLASNFANKFGITIVNPFSKFDELPESSSPFVKITPNTSEQIKFNVAYIKKKLLNASILLIHKNITEEQNLFEATKFELEKQNLNFKSINFNLQGMTEVSASLKEGQENCLIIPSNSKFFVTDLVSKLYQQSKSKRIKVIGLESWETFDNLDLNHLNNIGLHFSSSSFINYNDSTVVKFVNDYFSENSNQPTQYAFHGYDIGKYFSTLLISKKSIQSFKQKGLKIAFDFEKNKQFYFNNSIFMLQYSEFEKIKVTDFH